MQKDLMKRVSRRRMLELMLTGAATTALAACTTPPSSPPAPPSTGATVPPSPPTQAAAAPKPAATSPAVSAPVQKGGVLQVVLQGDPPGFDPHLNSAIQAIMSAAPCYNGIVRMDPETGTKVVGDLAEEWTISSDGTVYTFKLRAGDIRWHDGKPLTMDDVLFSLKRMGTAIPGKTVTMVDAFAGVSKIEPVDSRTFRIVLKAPSADFIWQIAQDFAKILPKHVLEAGGDMNKTVIGTGPFKFSAYRASAYVELVRNPDYAVQPGRPYLDGIRFTIVPDRTTFLQALAMGRADTEGRSGPEWLGVEEVNQIKSQNPNIKLWPLADTLMSAFFMNTSKPPFKDARVRKAAFLAIDRQLGIKVVHQGAAVLPGFFPEGFGLTTEELAQLPGFRQPKEQDLAEARRLLKEAGFESGLPFTMLSRMQPTILQPAEFMAQQLSQVGFKPTIKPTEEAEFRQRGAEGNFEGMVFTPGVGLPIGEFGRVIAPKGRLNYMRLDDDVKNNELWQKQLAESDPQKRRDLLKQVERYWYTELFGMAPLANKQSFFVSANRVQNFTAPVLTRGGMLFDTIWLKQ